MIFPLAPYKNEIFNNDLHLIKYLAKIRFYKNDLYFLIFNLKMINTFYRLHFQEYFQFFNYDNIDIYLNKKSTVLLFGYNFK